MKTFKNRFCKRCGDAYLPTGPAQKFCVACYGIHKREQGREIAERVRRRKGIPACGSGGNQKGSASHSFINGWSTFKEKKLESMDSYYCERCGKDLSDIVKHKRGYWAVHHKDKDRSNSQLDNLELLCKRCHQLEHECYKNFYKV